MSNVKRYLVNWHMEQLYEYKDGDVVMFSDFEKANYKAELYDEVWQKATEMGFMNVTMALAELAALREELADRNQEIVNACIERDAAEQRNADYLTLISGLVVYADNLLGEVNSAWLYAGSTGAPDTHKDDYYAASVALIAALKLTESGASE